MKGNKKFIAVCKHCGQILFKPDDPFIKVLVLEMKCPQCGKLLEMSRDILIKKPKEKVERA